MSPEKFKEDSETLYRFIKTYCDNKHPQSIKCENLLCEECGNLLDYGIERLKECPHEIKPSCRKCPHPCYERSMWKKMAHIMMYSGMRLGLTRFRKMLFK